MKKILLVATLMVAALSANAQFDPGTWTIQPRYGVSITGMKDAPAIDILPDGSSQDTQFAGGNFFGFDIEYQISSHFSMSVGLNRSKAGTGWEDHKWRDQEEGIDYEMTQMKLETKYISVPVMANVYLYKGLAIHGGVQFDYLIGAKMKGIIESESDGWDVDTHIQRGVKSSLEKFDVSIPVGISYEFENHIVLETRYNIGLLKVNKEDKEVEDMTKDIFNRGLTLTIGYKFEL